MKKLAILAFALTAWALSSAAAADAAPAALRDYDKNLVLLDWCRGAFLGPGKDAYVAFYQRKSTLAPAGEANVEVDVTKCFALERGKIAAEFELPFVCLQYTKEFNLASMDFRGLGKRIAYGWTGDFNGNGLTELFLYSLTGWAFKLEVYEFVDGAFRNLLRYVTTENAFYLVSVDKDAKSLLFVGKVAGTSAYHRFRWSAEDGVYGVVPD